MLVCGVAHGRYEPGPLERRQQRVFDPLLAWARQELGWQLHTSSSICGTTQPDDAVAAVRRYLEGALAEGGGVGRSVYCGSHGASCRWCLCQP